jgi:hypothetical protein
MTTLELSRNFNRAQFSFFLMPACDGNSGPIPATENLPSVLGFVSRSCRDLPDRPGRRTRQQTISMEAASVKVFVAIRGPPLNRIRGIRPIIIASFPEL